ncbi:MAG: CTP synthase [Candidatus Babeliales bacterium]|jgi:CTP synthase
MEITKGLQQVLQGNTKFIVVTGGVCSSIGKGVLVSSLGVLLKHAGYSVSVMKMDPYLNVDPGTMSPLVHGEVFVTADGAETDLDLGHYERMLGEPLTRDASVSAGQVFEEILQGEREGAFLGKCIQLVPHVVDTIKKRLFNVALSHDVDFVMLEIGGTVGDLEGVTFLEAVRQLKMDLGHTRVMHCHLSYVPFLSWTGEVKTKPTQHSVSTLKQAGLAPDALFLRADKAIEQESAEKLAIMCGVSRQFIFQVMTFNPVYQLFCELQKQGVDKRVQEHFKLAPRTSDLTEWTKFIELIKNPVGQVTIGLVAKYVGSNDPYISVVEAIKAAGYHCQQKVNIVVVEAEALEKETYAGDGKAWTQLKALDGIVVPGGFDKRGIEGKISAVRFARENNIPYFGLCLGMQMMIIEFARSLLQLDDANSTEFNQETKAPVIAMLAEQVGLSRKGGTMRLGSYQCNLVPGTKASAAYAQPTVAERHRHRYEVNNSYREALENVGAVFSGIYVEKNLVEITELEGHPFMLGTQFHPEFQSTPLKVHPLFKAFMEAVVGRQKAKGN